MPSKVLSLRDVRKASWLAQYNEVSLLSIDRDEDVWRVLSEVGFDEDYGYEYFACNHRDMSGVIGVGYVVAGSMSLNRKHLTSIYADLTDIMIAAAHQDPSLARELGELSGKQRSYDHQASLEDDSERSFAKELIEPTWGSVEYQIKELNDLCFHIRGSAFNSAGSLKTMADYKQYAEIHKGQQ